MGEIIRVKHGHPLVGTWKDADTEWGTSVQFTIRAVGDSFEVSGRDARDGETLEISNVLWDGRVLRFDSFVPSTQHRVEYAFEVTSPSELQVRHTVTDRWIRAEPTAPSPNGLVD